MMFMMRVFFFLFLARFSHGRLDGGRIGQGHRRQRLARMGFGALVIGVTVLVVRMLVIMMVMVVMVMVIIMMLGIILMFGVGMVMLGVVDVTVFGVRAFGVQALVFVTFLAFMRLGGLRRLAARVLDDLALDALATAAAARIAVARAAAPAGAVLALLFGLAMGALVGLDQRLTVGDRYLIIVRMDFAEGEEAVAVAAIFDEGRLQRRLDARDLGEVDIAAQLFALGGLEIKFFDAIAADHDNPGLFRVGSIDQHFVGHFGAHDGGGRVSR
nr:hypothetical protein [Bradyrhizobium erythrophlei]